MIKKSTGILCVIYYSVMFLITVLEYFHFIQIEFPIDLLILVLLLTMLFTRIAFPSHMFSNIKSIESLAEEQRAHVFMKWRTFFIILLPLILLVLVIKR